MTSVYDDIERRSMHQNIQLFIRSKANIAIFKHSLHKLKYYTKMPITVSVVFNYYTQFLHN